MKESAMPSISSPELTNEQIADLIRKHGIYGATCLADVFAFARAILAAAPPGPPVEPNSDEVICPKCAHQFRAIPVNVQRLMLDAGFEPPFLAPPGPGAVPPTEPVAWKSGDESWPDVILELVRMYRDDPSEIRWTALGAAIRAAAKPGPGDPTALRDALAEAEHFLASMVRTYAALGWTTDNVQPVLDKARAALAAPVPGVVPSIGSKS